MFDPAGIIFLYSRSVPTLQKFYTQRLGFRLWLDQGSCRILRRNNLLLGFCDGDRSEFPGIITLFYPEKAAVDKAYEQYRDIATGPPVENKKFDIYQFFAKDPEDRTLEFQWFRHPIEWP